MKKIKVTPIKSPEVCKKCIFNNCAHPYFEYCTTCQNSFLNKEENNGGKIYCCNCEYTDIGKPCKHFKRIEVKLTLLPNKILLSDYYGKEFAFCDENGFHATESEAAK